MTFFSSQHLILIPAMGVAATALLDLWALSLNRLFHCPATDWGLVGRWFSYLPRGRFCHNPISDTPAVSFERFTGWTGHYLVGVTYALLYMACLNALAQTPSLLSAVLFGVVTLLAPWLILQPGLGKGVFARATPNPALTRVMNLAAHTVFGLGLYLSWRLLNPMA